MAPARAGDHRIRLTDDDIALVIASLVARRATAGPRRRERIDRLVERLGQGLPGNPNFRRAVEYERHDLVVDAETSSNYTIQDA